MVAGGSTAFHPRLQTCNTLRRWYTCHQPIMHQNFLGSGLPMTDFDSGLFMRHIFLSQNKTGMPKVRDRPSENGVKKTKELP